MDFEGRMMWKNSNLYRVIVIFPYIVDHIVYEAI